MKKANYCVAIVFILLSGFVFFQVSGFQQTLIADDYVGAAFFPELLAWGTIVLAVLLGWLNFRNKFQEDSRSLSDLFPKEILTALEGLTVLCAYVLLLEPLGFILATIALNIALLLLFRVRSLITLAVFPVSISVIVYLVFCKALVVPLPEGLFYF